MIYLYIGRHSIKALHVSKSLLGQFSVQQSQKSFSVQLLKAGKVAHNDIVASAVKEVLSHFTGSALKEKHITLILPQEAFYYFRSEVPTDMTSSAVVSFMKEKAKSVFPAHLDNVYYDFVSGENESKRIVSLYGIEEATMQAYKESLQLLDVSIVGFLPDTLAYYKLFEKTLRRGKVEHILYGLYSPTEISAYLYDSFGLLEKEAFTSKLQDGKGVEAPLKKISSQYEDKHMKINRLILSGALSETVRQDTFTKEVGIWTNPLKRILPHFYADYLKMLVTADNQPFPLLDFDVCFGALIFGTENKNFTLLKNKFNPSLAAMNVPLSSKKSFALPGLRIPKEILFFVLSFVGSFALFTLLTRSPIGFNMKFPQLQMAKPTAVPTAVPQPTTTPTPEIKKEEIKVKILNGSGTPGKASEVRTVMRDGGFTDIVTGNADEFNFEVTEIAVKKGKEYLYTSIKESLVDYVTGVKEKTLDEDETADVVVTVGKDFK